jgi:hypothetical protein
LQFLFSLITTNWPNKPETTTHCGFPLANPHSGESVDFVLSTMIRFHYILVQLIKQKAALRIWLAAFWRGAAYFCYFLAGVHVPNTTYATDNKIVYTDAKVSEQKRYNQRQQREGCQSGANLPEVPQQLGIDVTLL